MISLRSEAQDKMDLDKAYQERVTRRAASAKLFSLLPGADEFVSRYGRVPTFHDGEVEEVVLTNKGPSRICISINWPDPVGRDKIVVTLTADQILDVGLEGFSPQNVINELWLCAATALPGYYEVEEGDLQLNMEPIYGISGKLVVRDLRVSWDEFHQS